MTAFYKHPLEILMDSLISSVVIYLLVGLGPAAGAAAMVLSGIGELFYHWNVKTPHWLGFIFQRPESHLVHHQEALHDYNYSDLPLWDMVFGTFRNPREWDKRCGLGEKNELRLREMLFGIDVWRCAPQNIEWRKSARKVADTRWLALQVRLARLTLNANNQL